MTKKRHSLRRPPSPPTELPYRVRTCGLIREDPYHSTRGTYHADAMLMLFVGGRGVYRRGGQEREVGAGMVGVVLPAPDVGLLLTTPRTPYAHFYCRFAGDEALRTARRIVREHGGEPFFPSPHWQQLADGFQTLLAQAQLRRPPGEERVAPVDAALAALLAALDRPTRAGASALTAAAFERYMRERLARPTDLDAMAAYFGVTKAHLCRVARQRTGTTLGKAWQRMRVDWAMVLLRESPMSVAEVSRRVGFDDPFYFSKVFRKHRGVSPRAWRQITGSADRPAP